MSYRLVRWITGTASYWFYHEIEVQELDHIPLDSPILLAVNHPNSLIDALVVIHIV